MTKRANLLLFIAGFLLTGLGAGLIIFSPKQAQPAKAAGYSMTWTAQKVITAEAVFGDYNSWAGANVTTGPASLGVSRWAVHGTVDSKTFDEVWSTPTFASSSLRMDIPGDRKRGCIINGSPFSNNSWLAGCFAEQSSIDNAYSRISKIDLKEQDPTTLGKQNRLNDGGGLQKSTSCAVDPGDNNATDCMITTGAYGFLYLQNLTIRAGGMMMPLEWDVTGTIN